MEKYFIIRKITTIGILVLFLIIIVQTTNSTQQKSDFIFYKIDQRSIEWEIDIDITETNGNYSYVVFGEAPDANDGLPEDIYDVPLPPGPPGIRCWFDDGLNYPFNTLLEDFRFYPDVQKIWNLSVQWFSLDFKSSTIITISWNISDLNKTEYTNIKLYDDTGSTLLIDMKAINNYTFSASSYMINNFKIICTEGVENLLKISNVTTEMSNPKDTQIGWENISCTITSNNEIQTIYLNLTYPDMHTESLMMTKSGDNYYYNTTLLEFGTYNYHIWIEDINGNSNTSTIYFFELPPNWDINIDHDCSIVDLIRVANHFDQTGLSGWIREDVNNDGDVSIVDLIQVANHFDETW